MSEAQKPGKKRGPEQKQLPFLGRQPRYHYAGGSTIYRMKGDRSERVKPGDLEDADEPTQGFRVVQSLPVEGFPRIAGGIVHSIKMVVESAYPLGAQELRVMHAILGYISKGDAERVASLSMEDDSELGKKLIEELGYEPNTRIPQVVANAMPFLSLPQTVRLQTSLTELSRATGKNDDGRLLKIAERALDALESATVRFYVDFEQDGKMGRYKSEKSPMIRCATLTMEETPGSRHHKKTLFISIEPHIVRNILTQGAYRMIDLDEVRGLRGEAAILLHNYFCGFIDNGAKVAVLVDTMVAAIYRDDEKKPPSSQVMAKRRMRVRAAMKEIAAAGWKFTPVAGKSTKLLVERPKMRSLNVIDLSGNTPLLPPGAPDAAP